VRGALAMAYAMYRGDAAANRGKRTAFILPRASADEAALVENAAVYPAQSLLEVCAHFGSKDGAGRLERHRAPNTEHRPSYPDLSEVKGQTRARRALEVAAAGGHSMLMVAARFPGILPPLSERAALESAAVQSIAGNFSNERWKTRPYRAPHHTASAVALVGGGNPPRPGEISLAHHGVLFLDELPEFDRKVLEVLREPLESGRIHLSRAARQAEYPARFQLIAAMNPCPCGYLGHPSGKCRCTPDAVNRYQDKISGPLLDRIDLRIEVPALATNEMMQHAPGENSAAVAERVAQANAIQHARQEKTNSALSTSGIEAHCTPDTEGEQLLRTAAAKLNWSARSHHRVLKIARTIADLAGSATICAPHVAEAIQYRRTLRE
jgi:magnesium chelatase family protein